MSYAITGQASSHVAEKNDSNHWTVNQIGERTEHWRFITGSNGTSRYLLRMENGAMVARTYRTVPVESSSWGERAIRLGKTFTLAHDDLPKAGLVIVVGKRVGYLTWFGGRPEYSGSNIDGGVIHKAYVSSQHRRKGVATALLDLARETFPDSDIRHSDALSADGAGFAAATPTPNDLPRRRATAA